MALVPGIVLRPNVEQANTVAGAAAAGVDLAAVTAELEREGVQSFCDSYYQLLNCIERKLDSLDPADGVRST